MWDSMRNKFNLALLLLCTMCMVSCTNWQEKYDADIADLAQRADKQYEFVKEKLEEADLNGKVYSSGEDLPLEVALSFVLLAPDTLPYTMECPSDILLSLNFVNENSDNLLYNYDEYISRTVKNKDDYEYCLRHFEHDVVKRLLDAKYLVVVEPLHTLKPAMSDGDSFEMGYILDKVSIYDMATSEKVKELEVISRSSESLSEWVSDRKLSHFDNDKLMSNLQKNRKNVVLDKVLKALP